MTSDTGPNHVAVEIVEALEQAHIPCAIGGAIALGFWAGPRGTKEADINAFVGEERYEELLEVLAEAGCEVDHPRCLHQARKGEVVVVQKVGVRVDVFVPSIPFYTEAERRVRRVTLLGRSVPVLDPETLAVFKLLFFRSKDMVDLEHLVALQGDSLDHEWVRRQIVDMVGEDDERVARWDRIVQTFARDDESV